VKEGTQSAAIVRAINRPGERLDVPIIAEGVEVADQLSFCGAKAAKRWQGYLVGRPCPIEDYAEETHGRLLLERGIRVVVAFY